MISCKNCLSYGLIFFLGLLAFAATLGVFGVLCVGAGETWLTWYDVIVTISDDGSPDYICLLEKALNGGILVLILGVVGTILFSIVVTVMYICGCTTPISKSRSETQGGVEIELEESGNNNDDNSSSSSYEEKYPQTVHVNDHGRGHYQEYYSDTHRNPYSGGGSQSRFNHHDYRIRTRDSSIYNNNTNSQMRDGYDYV